MKPNTIEIEGIIYIAAPDDGDDGCSKCDLINKRVCHLVPCLSEERVDGTAAHWEASNGRPV